MYQHILLVTDLQDDTDLVAARAKWILDKEDNAQITVLHIVEETSVGFGYELIPAAALHDQIDDERVHIARSRLGAILTRNDLQVHDVKVTTAISSRRGIVDYCNKHTVDLMIIGRHKRTGLSAWIMGATADSILPDVACDLLVVPLSCEE